MTEEVAGHRVHQLGIIDIGPVAPVVTQHERGANHRVGGLRRQSGEPGPVQAGLEDCDLVMIISAGADRHRGEARAARATGHRDPKETLVAGPASAVRSAAGMNHGLISREPSRQIVQRVVRCQAIVRGQDVAHQRKSFPVAHFVTANAFEGTSLSNGIRQLDQATVGQFGTRLESDVELAVPPERLEAQLTFERRGNAPQCSGNGNEHAGRAGPKRRSAEAVVRRGSRCPARYRPLNRP